ncbi:MAG: hypothetical protein QNJ85_02845 [Gammaproteobacteria bacterium]|nr:hypothetical protein [Gammaproteobacteria bacterium]
MACLAVMKKGMWWSLCLLLLAGWTGFRYSDLEHASTLHAVSMPLLCLLFVMALSSRVVVCIHRHGSRHRRRGSGRFDVGLSSATDIDAGGGDRGYSSPARCSGRFPSR